MTRRPLRLMLSLALVVVTFGVGAAVAWYGGAIRAGGWSGFVVDTGWTPFLLPAARLALDAAAVVTVGCLLAAAFLVPGDGPMISPVARSWIRAAGWAAAGWALAALASMCLTLSDLVGLPLGQAVTFNGLANLAVSIETGQVLFAVLVLTSAVAIACQYIRTVTGAAVTALVAVIAVLPPAFSGHAASAGNHQLAVSTLVLHICGAVLWTGGLLALILGRRRPVAALAASVARFSKLAGACFVIVAASGVVIAAVRLFEPRGLVSTFGLLVLGKVTALVALGGLGWQHRRRSLPLLASGDRRIFTRIAVVESLVMAATFGLAVALARTPSPATASGYRLSPFAPVLDVLPEPLFFTAALGGIAAYFGGVQRLRDRDEPWPAVRIAAWIAAWVVILLATDLELAVNSGRRFGAIEGMQHVAMVVVVPLLLVAASPLTLARSALRPAAEPDMRGPLEWLRLVMASAGMRAAAHPVSAASLYAVSLSLMYLSAHAQLSLRGHASHLAIFGFALVAGALLFGVVRGFEADGSPIPREARPALSIAAAAMQLVLAVALVLPTAPRPTVVALALALPVAALSLWIACRPNPAGPPARPAERPRQVAAPRA